ncbi:MAG: glycosyltransferase family 2 protein [Sphingobacteriales bacterium]|nr:MAG: glycosyltransferase family 2 protein [Sphingobacteriales bacterium]
MNDNKQNIIPGKSQVAVVILNWNGKKFLEQFLPSVLNSSYENMRVIVADNASTDDSVLFLRQTYPQIEIIINSSNEGFAKGYNSALKKIQSDYYVLLNSDVEVTTGWIEPVIALMESDQTIAVCQPKLLAYHNKSEFEYAGASGGWIDKLGYPFARGRVFENCETDRGQYDEPRECFWASGAALFIRPDIYHRLGGLDEYFFAHQEEIDLCWRIKLTGFKIFVQPASVVYHVGGGTLPKGNSRKTYLNFRNNLIMLYKNLPATDRIKKIPFRFCLDGIAAWKALFAGDGGYFIAVLKAHLHVIRWIFFEQKQSLFVKDKQNISSGFYTGSIVWDHFIKKKKTFLEIVGNK